MTLKPMQVGCYWPVQDVDDFCDDRPPVKFDEILDLSMPGRPILGGPPKLDYDRPAGQVFTYCDAIHGDRKRQVVRATPFARIHAVSADYWCCHEAFKSRTREPFAFYVVDSHNPLVARTSTQQAGFEFTDVGVRAGFYEAATQLTQKCDR